MKLTRTVFFLIFPLLLLGCKKDPPAEPEPTEPVMPPATQIGANTFGCYIDGELFVAGGGESVWDLPPVSGSFNEGNNELKLQGTRYREGKSDNLKIYCYLNHETGIYEFEMYESEEILAYRNWYGDRCNYYYTDIADLGKLNITYLNKEENIISGTFYINLINPDCEGDTIMKITDGRFDFRY